MRELVEYVVRYLVDNPDEIKISEVLGEKTLIYEVRCNKSDVGKVIGKSGRTIAALRTVLNSASSRDGKKTVLEIVQ